MSRSLNLCSTHLPENPLKRTWGTDWPCLGNNFSSEANFISSSKPLERVCLNSLYDSISSSDPVKSSSIFDNSILASAPFCSISTKPVLYFSTNAITFSVIFSIIASGIDVRWLWRGTIHFNRSNIRTCSSVRFSIVVLVRSWSSFSRAAISLFNIFTCSILRTTCKRTHSILSSGNWYPKRMSLIRCCTFFFEYVPSFAGSMAAQSTARLVFINDCFSAFFAFRSNRLIYSKRVSISSDSILLRASVTPSFTLSMSNSVLSSLR